MAYGIPNGSTFDIAATYSAEVAIVSISNANPAVVTATAHGFTTGDIVFINTGWEFMNNRAFKVGTVATDTFVLQGDYVDTTNTTFYPAGSSAGTVKSVDTWSQVTQITNLEFAGFEQNYLDVQFLASKTQVQLPTFKSAATLTLTVADDPDQPYVPLVKAYDFDLSTNVLRMNLVKEDSILYTAIVSWTPSPTVTINELITNTIGAAVQAQPTRYTR